MSERPQFNKRSERRSSVFTAVAAASLVLFPGPDALAGKRVAPPPEVFIPFRSPNIVQSASARKVKI